MNLQKAVELCKRFEGLYLKPYLCPAGVATIGYGTTRYPNGVSVTLHDAPITRTQAELYLMHDLTTIRLPAVMALCPSLSTEAQICAIVDFAYNLGLGALKGSTLRKRLNSGDISGAVLELAKWNKSGGKVLKGLVLRRTAEADLLQLKLNIT